MKKLIAVLLLLAAPALAQEVHVIPQADGSAVILLPAETVKFCTENGGCRIVSGADLERFASEVKKSCGPAI